MFSCAVFLHLQHMCCNTTAHLQHISAHSIILIITDKVASRVWTPKGKSKPKIYFLFFFDNLVILFSIFMIFSWASQKVSLSLDILLAGGGRGNSSTLSIFSSTISRRLFWVTLDCVTNANIGEVCSWGGSETDDASVGPVLTGGDVDKEEIKETLGDGAWYEAVGMFPATCGSGLLVR